MSLRQPVITNLGNLEPVSNNFKEFNQCGEFH